jgi:hypothetical protein
VMSAALSCWLCVLQLVKVIRLGVINETAGN